jgi:hypothetical protein
MENGHALLKTVEGTEGTEGYAQLLGILSNPEHEQYLDMMSWLGGRFHRAAFSAAKANRSLKALYP